VMGARVTGGLWIGSLRPRGFMVVHLLAIKRPCRSRADGISVPIRRGSGCGEELMHRCEGDRHLVADVQRELVDAPVLENVIRIEERHLYIPAVRVHAAIGAL